MPDDPSDADDEDLTSRSDIKRARKTREDALARLAKSLSELSEAKLEKLELPEEVLDAILSAKAMRSHGARNRQLRIVRGQLRSNNWPAIVARLDQLQKHGRVNPLGPRAASDAQAREWIVKLLGQGNEALNALLEVHPELDRKHIRTLVRNIQNSSAERRARAEDKLARTLEPMFR